MKYSNLESIALHKIEAQVPELNPLRTNLPLAEYYSHCVPFIAEYILKQFNLDDIIMLNSDCYFSESPAVFMNAINSDSPAIIIQNNAQIAQYFPHSGDSLEAIKKIQIGIDLAELNLSNIKINTAVHSFKTLQFISPYLIMPNIADANPISTEELKRNYAPYIDELYKCLGSVRSYLPDFTEGLNNDIDMNANSNFIAHKAVFGELDDKEIPLAIEEINPILRYYYPTEKLITDATNNHEFEVNYTDNNTSNLTKLEEELYDITQSLRNEISNFDDVDISSSQISEPNYIKPYLSNSNTQDTELPRPEISVIMPTQGMRPEMMKPAIDSVLNQMFENYELIVVSDGGVDIADYINSFGDDRIKYYYNSEHRGCAYARNYAISKAQGKYIAYLDDDDKYYPEHLEILHNYLESTEFKIAYTDSYRVEQVWHENQYLIARKHVIYSEEFDYEKILIGNFVPIINIMHEKSCTDKLGTFDENLSTHEDWELWLRLSREYKLSHIKLITAEYTWRQDSSSISSSNRRDFIESKKYVYDKYKHLTEKKPNILKLQSIDIASLEYELEQKSENNTLEYRPTIPPSIKQTDNELKASIIIPVCNGLAYTKQCIESVIENGSKYKFEIIVVDNNSNDGTQEYLHNLTLSESIKLITNNHAVSYSKSNNQGAEIAKGKYLVFLNNDTKTCPNWLDNLIERFKADDSIGLQGAKLLYDDSHVQHCGIVYGYLKSDLLTHYHVYLSAPASAERVNKEREFQFVTGALLAIRSEVFREVKGFDENYYFGYEDLDLCLKVRRVGFRVLYNPKIETYHFESKTKELIGIDNFDPHYAKPNGIDHINYQYFMSKWQNYLKIDDLSYYREDGMHGLLNDGEERNRYIQRVEKILNSINDLLVTGNNSKAEQIIRMLFDADLDVTQINRYRQFNIPLSNIENAEAELEIVHNSLDGIDKDNSIELIEQESNNHSIEDYHPDNTPKDRILFVMYGWNESGGGTTLPKSIALELAANGYRVAVFYASLSLDTSKPQYSLEVSSDSGVTLYGLFNRPAVFTDANNPLREINDDRVNEQFAKVLDEFRPDVIHYHNFHGLTMSIAQVAKQRDIPSCFTPHNYYIIDPNLYLFDMNLNLWDGVDMIQNSFSVQQNPELIDDYRLRIKSARNLINEDIDITLAVSTRQKQLLCEFGCDPNKMPIVHQANRVVDDLLSMQSLIDASKRKITEPIKFGFIGGVMPQKGVHLIAAAAQYFPPEIAEFHIFGFVTDYYKQLLDEIDKSKRLIYHGQYNYNELAEIGTKIDIALVPSVWEDCAPLVVLELISMKLPVIGTNIGGISDFIIENKTGFLFAYNSIVELVSIIDKCIRDKESIEAMRINMPQVYSFDHYFDNLKQIYKSLKDKDMRDPLSFEIKYNDFIEPNNQATPILNSEVKPAELILPEQAIVEVDDFDDTDEEFIREYLLTKDFKVLNYALDDNPEAPYFDLNLSVRIFKNPTASEELPIEQDSNIEYMTELLESETSRANIDHSIEVPDSYHPELNIIWEGTQFVYHSLALINREICAKIIESEVAELTIVPYEDDKFFDPEVEKYAKLAAHDIRFKEKELSDEIKSLPYVWIRHQWPPKAEEPKGTKWIIMQPWEFTAHRKDFVDIFNRADEIWTPSNFSRRSFIDSGVDFNKVQVIPNGIDPELFTPLGDKYPIPTLKRFKILFVGGTVYRKGADVLLEAYMKLFTAEDDVCLIIKDIGGDSFYKGQTAKAKIEEFKNIPNAPEIHYIDQKLTEWEMAELYRAADIFVSSYRGEGFSLPTLEAMACGLPVMVTEGGATDDFVDESVGWLIPAASRPIGAILDEKPLTHEAFLLEPNIDELMRMLRYVVSDPSQIFKKGVNAMLRARSQWTWKNSMMKVYSRLDAIYGTNMAKRSMDKMKNIDDDLIIFAKACKEFESHNFDKALELWNEVIMSEQLPQRYKLHIYHNLALHFMLLGELDKTESLLNIAIKDVIEHPDNSYLRTILLAKQDKYTEAYDTLSFIYDTWIYKKADTTLGIALDNLLSLNGEIAYLEGDLEIALQLFSESLKFNSENPDACYGAGLCFAEVGADPEAREMFEWAIKFKPQFAEAQEELWKLENKLQDSAGISE